MNLHSLIRRIIVFVRKFVLPQPLEDDDAQQCIAKVLSSPNPCMIGRFGSAEIQAVVNSILPPPFSLFLRKRTWNNIFNNAGFFPVNKNTLSQFKDLMIDSMKQCDVLASWRIEECLFKKELKHSTRIMLSALGPIDKSNSWHYVLEGKKVLVVSPFAELIKEQYENKRELIWEKGHVLPPFEKLLTLKSVNSIGGHCEFASWFDALEWMKKEIEQMDFDIAILGCGAYGYPLAAYIKQIGKKAIHIGGATQLFFGIKGKRWEKSTFINEHWVSPRIEDRPKGWEKVEGGCYW